MALVINILRKVGQEISSANQGNQMACYLMECEYEWHLQDWKGLGSLCQSVLMTTRADTKEKASLGTARLKDDCGNFGRVLSKK